MSFPISYIEPFCANGFIFCEIQNIDFK